MRHIAAAYQATKDGHMVRYVLGSGVSLLSSTFGTDGSS